MIKKLNVLFLLIILSTGKGKAFTDPIGIKVVADRENWTYAVGEEVRFRVSVTGSDPAVSTIKIRYQIGPEKQQPVTDKETTLKGQEMILSGGTMKKPGFLRCIVTATIEGKELKGMATAAFSHEKITPSNSFPDDFSAFWKQEIAAAAAYPLDPVLTPDPSKDTEHARVFHVSFRNGPAEQGRIFGYLAVPRKPGRYPAMIRFPGAGIRAHSPNVAMPQKGIITLQIGIHGIPVNMEPGVYENLFRGALMGYPFFNLDDRSRYYFKRVFLGCVRAVDFIHSLPEFNGEQMAVAGSSQGGALSIVTAALDKRVDYVLAFCPALCDLTGYFAGRAAGWPNMFNASNANLDATKDKVKTSAYYDVANFARLLTVPGYYSWGFNDETTPPTSMHAAYNVITAPKDLYIVPEVTHTISPEQSTRWIDWIVNKLTSP